MEINTVELFCGSGTISKAFKEKGFNTFTTDIRRRKGICEPDLRKSILQLSSRDILYKKVHVLWASPPCDVWSHAAGDFHWHKDRTPKTKKCIEHIEILRKTLELIEELDPEVWFIENPRGRLRNYPLMRRFLRKHQAFSKTLTYSSYGFPTPKPTNIFTNARDIEFKGLDRFGRGAKVKTQLYNITKCNKQKIPRALADKISSYVQDRYSLSRITKAPIQTTLF